MVGPLLELKDSSLPPPKENVHRYSSLQSLPQHGATLLRVPSDCGAWCGHLIAQETGLFY